MSHFTSGLKLLSLCCLIINLNACSNTDEQKVKFLEEGTRSYKVGDYKKAQLAFDNAIAIDPKNTQIRYEVAEALSALGDIQSAAKQYQMIVNQDARHLMARVKLGKIYLLASKIEDAEKMAKEALAIDAESIDAQVLQGGVFAAQNNSDAAFVIADAAVKKSPDDFGATQLLALLTARTGKIDKAIDLLQKFIETHKDNVDSHLMLANFLIQNNESAKVESLLEATVKLEPKRVDHRKRWAIFLINNKNFDKAETILRQAVTDLPDDEQAKLMLIDFLSIKRTPEVAIAELLPMIGQNAGNYELRFKLAELQLAQKQVSDVEESLKEIIELDKHGEQSIKASNKLARLYLSTRRINEAKELLKELATNNPNDVDTLTLRGEMAIVEGRVTDAIADFRAALVQKPNNIKVLKLLSAAHLINKDGVLARENMEKVLEVAPNDETARLDLVNLLLQGGEKELATQQLNILFKLNPNSKIGLEALYKIYSAQKQWDQALQAAKRLENAYVDDATGYYLSGMAYQALGKLEQSSSSFEEGLRKQPQAAELLTQLVKNYLVAKKADKALDKLQGMLKVDPKNFFAYNLLGEVYSRTNKFSDAINAYKQAISIKPAWATPYRNIAAINMLQKQKNDAIDILNKGINSANEPLELVGELAALYHQDGEHQKVIELYEEIYKKNPDSLPMLNNLVRYIADYMNSVEALSRAANLAQPLATTNDPYMLDTVAWIAYKQGRYEKSRELLLKVNELNANLAVSQYHLGMVYFKLGDKLQAKEYLQNAINKKENFNGLADAKEALQQLVKSSK